MGGLISPRRKAERLALVFFKVTGRAMRPEDVAAMERDPEEASIGGTKAQLTERAFSAPPALRRSPPVQRFAGALQPHVPRGSRRVPARASADVLRGESAHGCMT